LTLGGALRREEGRRSAPKSFINGFLRGPPPRAEGRAAGVSPSFALRVARRPDRAALTGGRSPSPAAAHPPLHPPVSPTGRGAAAAAPEPERGRSCLYRNPSRLTASTICGELLQRRREQVQACAEPDQPALFELREDHRPASDRTAAGRYREPSLFTLLDGEG
jgi:hypothetical protein